MFAIFVNKQGLNKLWICCFFLFFYYFYNIKRNMALFSVLNSIFFFNLWQNFSPITWVGAYGFRLVSLSVCMWSCPLTFILAITFDLYMVQYPYLLCIFLFFGQTCSGDVTVDHLVTLAPEALALPAAEGHDFLFTLIHAMCKTKSGKSYILALKFKVDQFWIVTFDIVDLLYCLVVLFVFKCQWCLAFECFWYIHFCVS